MPTDAQRVQAIFLAAAEVDVPAARAAFLDGACGGDAELRARVESLLRAHDNPDSLLDSPAVAPHDCDGATTRTIGHEAATPPDDEIPLGFLAPATRPDSLGRIGHYEVLEVLGHGGFGIVFRAFDDVLHRVVAVKVLAPQLAATSPARKRFLREARTSAQVRHENVVQVYEVGEDPLPYIAMEFIPGETLQQRLNRVGPVDPAEVVRVGRQIAEGLAAAHAQDLIHRDIKPGNILLEAGAGRVKITDFGLARAADDASISQSGVIAGTPMYMAPEQAKGEKLDQRADLFSLGSVLYQMACGRPPFRANGTVAVLKRVAEDTPRDIREITPETPQWLCDVIAKLHAKNPDDRFQTAREVADVLADCEAQLKAHTKLKDFSRIPRGTASARARGGRNWAAIAVVVLICAVAAGAAVYAGVTALFRGQLPTPGPGLAVEASTPASTPAPAEENWVQLFNGKDLTGWEGDPSKWAVENGLLVTRVPEDAAPSSTALATVRHDYRDFQVRLVGKINSGGDSGLIVPLPTAGQYIQAQIKPGHPVALLGLGERSLADPKSGLRANQWFTMEVIVNGPDITVRVDGEHMAARTDPTWSVRSGSIALEGGFPGTEFLVRKIEVRELRPSLPPTFTNGIGMEFVRVPKGKSWLGGGKDKLGDREVDIPADFYLGKYEVTQEEWVKVMGENPSHFSRTGDGKDAVKDISDADLKRFPVENVSWDQCQVFVAKLNEREKEAGWVYRLPTEVEWEYACRGGPMANKADSAFDFYFAKPTNTLSPDQANFNTSLNRTCKVGSYEANHLGLFDLHGNVFEWCYDSHVIPADGSLQRGHTGGSWHAEHSAWCRAQSGVIWGPPSQQSDFLGLRLARVPAGAASPEAKTPTAVAPFTDADVKRIAALPAEQQVEEVRKELVRRNPGFDGKIEHKIEGGVVTEFKIVTDKVTDISPIRVFNALRVLDCHGTWTGKPNGLLADLSRLEGMNLAGLNTLDLRDTQVSDAGMVYFRDCKNLTGLFLSSTRVSDAGLANFNDCKALIELSLRGMKVTDAGLNHFKDCTNLQVLDLGSTSATAAGLTLFMAMPLRTIRSDGSEIADLTSLRGMALEDIRLTPKSITKGLEVLRSMKSIKTIAVDANQPQPAAEFWERYDKGEFTRATPPDRTAAEYVLSIGGTVKLNGGDKEVKAPADLPREAFRLTSADLRHNRQVTDARLADFAGCQGLQAINLSSTPVTDVGLSAFKDCKGLTFIDLQSTAVTDDGLAYFRGCNDLVLLELGGTQTGDAGLAHFGGCKKLIHLGVPDTRVTDAGLAPLRDCLSLVFLNLSHTQIGDAGLAHFKGCKALTGLWLEGTQVTDAALADVAGMGKLTEVRLANTKVTAKGVAELAKALPKCKITWAGGTLGPK